MKHKKDYWIYVIFIRWPDCNQIISSFKTEAECMKTYQLLKSVSDKNMDLDWRALNIGAELEQLI